MGHFDVTNGQGTGPSSLWMLLHVGAKHEIVVDIEGFQMRREMSSHSEDSYISGLSDSDHEERKVEEEESSVQIASSVCGTNVTSQIKSCSIWTARFEYHFFGTKNGSTSSAHKIFRFYPKHLKLRNCVHSCIMHQSK